MLKRLTKKLHVLTSYFLTERRKLFPPRSTRECAFLSKIRLSTYMSEKMTNYMIRGERRTVDFGASGATSSSRRKID